ncbi:uncharacterized protein [Diadema antillarum]|uniref:uncharacterized protein n=1 Tax=Diadema antillarum TaxID=105358 RepID=UPI003A887743
MAHNTNLMHLQMPPSKRPTVPSTVISSRVRTLGTSRGVGGNSGDLNLSSSVLRSDPKRERDDPNRTSLCLKDITKFDLMSPFVVQQLTGSFRSSFPTVASVVSHPSADSLKMLSMQLPKSPYTSLPRLAVTKATSGSGRDDSRYSLTRNLSRSQSELSNYRPQDSVHALLDRPHTEGRRTRRPVDGGLTSLARDTDTISEESSSRLQDSDSGSFKNAIMRRKSDPGIKSKVDSDVDNSPQNCDTIVSSVTSKRLGGDGVKATKEPLPRQRLKARAQTRQSSRQTARGRRSKKSEKIADLSISAYTEVNANNKEIRGHVWSGVKPRTAPEGSRVVRFNTSNDVFEYFT